MRARLQLRVGHKEDMFFAVSIVKNGNGYLIHRTFYNRQKCITHIEWNNLHRDYT